MEIHLAKVRERLSIDARHLPDAVILDTAQTLLDQFLAEHASGKPTWDGLPGTFHALLTLELEALADTPQRLTRRQARVPRPLRTQQAVHGTPITRNPLCDDPLGAMKGGSLLRQFLEAVPRRGRDSAAGRGRNIAAR